MNEKCSSYEYSYYELLIPPPNILDKLCTSVDKTYLFIISFVRVLSLAIIVNIFYNITNGKGLSAIVISILIIYLIINTIILFIIIFKKSK
ncbi:hypothetical protein Catovirus_2_288 [Catovirus CTV1]|uniref:Uncharacterized protein n=1 Tax=Catovirus CTV1 TaxID=1977631 RepID=A0A1V0SCA6_9VIRU|nr:hypothetical protein Catovirus_2_288 [Catovirus CTV1]